MVDANGNRLKVGDKVKRLPQYCKTGDKFMYNCTYTIEYCDGDGIFLSNLPGGFLARRFKKIVPKSHLPCWW